jgi:hypothetical protein
MLRKNELENIVNHHLIEFRSLIWGGSEVSTTEIAKEIVAEIKRCLSLPT